MSAPFLADLLARGELPDLIKPQEATYFCVVCGNRAREQFAPICTGPHPTLDEHEPLIMERLPNG